MKRFRALAPPQIFCAKASAAAQMSAQEDSLAALAWHMVYPARPTATASVSE